MNEHANQLGLIWHRRDLRIDDNPALHKCISDGKSPVGVFVFDTNILEQLDTNDRRLPFIFDSVLELQNVYNLHGCNFHILHGDPKITIPNLAKSLGVTHVYANIDYENSSIERDSTIASNLATIGKNLHLSHDHAIVNPTIIKTKTGTFHTIFTPYKRAWIEHLSTTPPAFFDSATALKKIKTPPITHATPEWTLQKMGFHLDSMIQHPVRPGEANARRSAKQFAKIIDDYQRNRDFPNLPATSRLGPHLRHGTISPRRLARWALAINGDGPATWLSELAWRDFYTMIMANYPHIQDGHCFQKKYDNLKWGNDPAKIQAWKNGKTGYPIVDAGMRELLATGHMHNRVRMITASFLTKHLDCDWRIGEKHFASLLMDFEFASNNGGWQWSASTGCDAQPYFRIFNPTLQSERFDPDGFYIKKWVPELGKLAPAHIHAPHEAPMDALSKANVVLNQTYPQPVVAHKIARELAIKKFKI